MSVADANQLFYEKEAAHYEQCEPCLNHARHRARTHELLDQAVACVTADPRVAVDACGGTGYISAQLLDYGFEPVLVDVSPEMTAIWVAKARDRGVEPEVHVAPVEVFFDADAREWSLIVFSSALHHLDDYAATAGVAASRVSPGGALLTTFDPIRSTSVVRLLRRLDWMLWLLFREPQTFLDALRRVSRRRLASTPRTEDVLGRLAERYAVEGVDDQRVIEALERNGLEIVLHRRDCEARLAISRRLLRLCGASTDFSIIARRP